jgi:hypothetical protein
MAATGNKAVVGTPNNNKQSGSIAAGNEAVVPTANDNKETA